MLISFVQQSQTDILILIHHWFSLTKSTRLDHPGLRSLVTYCQNNELMEILGYGPLLKNMDFLDDLLNDLRDSEMAKSFSDFKCQSQNLSDLDLVKMACDSEKRFGLEVQIAVRLEIIRLCDTLDTTEKDPLGTLESRLLESIVHLPQAKRFLARCKEAKCLKEFLRNEIYFPNFDFSKQKSDFLHIKNCSKCGFKFDPNLDIVKKNETELPGLNKVCKK